MNPVTDKLENWQPDSDTIDSNLPVPATSIGVSTVGDLSGELRRIKSEIRALSLNMSWERWLGVTSLTTAVPINFSTGSPTTFNVNDNLISAARPVAQPGRRVKAVLGGSTLYGTIVNTQLIGLNTSIACLWDGGGQLDVTLREVQFGPFGRAIFNPVLRIDPAIPTISGAGGQVQTIFAHTIPANFLGTQNQIVLDLDSRLGMLPGQTISVTAYFGGQQGPGIGFVNENVITIPLILCPIKVTLTGASGPNVQSLVIEGKVTNNVTVGLPPFNNASQNLGQVIGLGVDSTLDQTLLVSLTFGAVDSAMQADYLSAKLQLFAI